MENRYWKVITFFAAGCVFSTPASYAQTDTETAPKHAVTSRVEYLFN
jgi:hypothetical protein